MNLNLSVLYLSLVIIIGFASVFGTNQNFNCRKVRSPDGNHVVNLCPAPKRNRGHVCDMQDTWVVITVDPILDKEEARKLQIVWKVPEVLLGDVIKLYKSSRSTSHEPVFEVIPYAPYGLSETHIYETYIDIDLKFEPICLGYYVIYWRKSQVLSTACLQTNPTWMRHYNFGKMRLWDMFIPGTHDSSAYHTAYNPEDTGRIDDYVFTQEQNILEQLVHGARALDLRVGKDGGTYFAHHGVAQLYPFQEVMTNITLFVERTQEVLILDFHEFPIGFKGIKDHMEFLNHIYSQLGPYMVPPNLGWNATLQDIWATGKHLIVSYNYPAAYDARKDILWPPITQMWGNVQNVTALYDYLTSSFESPPEGMWSAQAELTAKASNVFTNSLGGLRRMAQKANTQVSKWFRRRWGSKCHIVAMDFIRASSIVNIAIEWNLRKTYRKLCPIDRKEKDDEKKRAAEEESQRKLEEEERPRKEAEAKHRRIVAEKRRQRKERQRIAAEAERQKKAEEERQRKAEEERQRKEEEERQRREEERQRREEEEKQRREEERRRREEEKQRRESGEERQRRESERQRKESERQRREAERQRREVEEGRRRIAAEAGERLLRKLAEIERQRSAIEDERQRIASEIEKQRNKSWNINIE